MNKIILNSLSKPATLGYQQGSIAFTVRAEVNYDGDSGL